MHINYIFEILRHRAHCTLLYQLQLQSIHIYIQCQRHPTAYSIGILTTTTLELKSWARFQLRCTLRWQYPELVMYRMYSPHYALPTRRRHRNRTQDWIQHGLPIYMGDSDFNAWVNVASYVHTCGPGLNVGLNAGTRGSYGPMRSNRSVMSDTGPDTCGPCGVHVLHNSPSAISNIATLPQPMWHMMALEPCTHFPYTQSRGTFFSFCLDLYVRIVSSDPTHAVNSYFTRSRPINHWFQMLPHVAHIHHQMNVRIPARTGCHWGGGGHWSGLSS